MEIRLIDHLSGVFKSKSANTMKTPIYADLDKIVFEGREQDYGAYQMRKHYNRYLTRAMLLAFLLFISLTALPKVVFWIVPPTEEDKTPDRMETQIELLHTPDPIEKQDLPEPMPIQPKLKKPKVKTIAFKVPKPSANNNIDENNTIANVDSLDKKAIGLKNTDGDDGDYDWDSIGIDTTDILVVGPEPKTKNPGIDDFVMLEKEPMPVNMDQLRKMIGYPPMAIEAEIEGKVVVRVLVDKYGDYIKHSVLKDPHPILTRAVSSQVNKLKVTPGIQAGKPISVWITIPFDFVLLK